MSLFSHRVDSVAPREGAYIHGLFMEGARWDIQSGIIVESRLKELFPSMPVINVRVGHKLNIWLSASIASSQHNNNDFLLEKNVVVYLHKTGNYSR